MDMSQQPSCVLDSFPSLCILGYPPPLAPPLTTPTPQSDHFIAARHQTWLYEHEPVTFVALYLLQHLKAWFPTAKGSLGHCLFISTFMLSSKIICNNTYSKKPWCIVNQGMFALWKINQMEWEICSYLECQLNVDPSTLHNFQYHVQQDFAGPRPYPMVLPQLAPFKHQSLSSGLPSLVLLWVELICHYLFSLSL